MERLILCGGGHVSLEVAHIARRLEFVESHHWAEQSDHRWHFTPQGFLLSNTLILELLDAQSGTIQEQTYWKELIGQPDSDQDP